MRTPIFALAGMLLLASGAFAGATTVNGADHRDSPLNQANATADINDVYAFRSPENSNNLVLALSVNPLIVPADNLTRGNFDPSVQYQVHMDRNGDLIDDVTVNIRMTNNPPTLIVEGLGAPLAARITPPNATVPVVNSFLDGAVKIFAGLRDDPFFFDLAAFQQFVANPQAPAKGLRPAGGGDPVDAFTGTNILAIVIEAPVTVVTGATSASTGTVKAWVSTSRGGRIDRMAIPAINTALIPSAQKDAFNQGSPITDAANYRATASATITTLRGAVDKLFGNQAQDGGPLGQLTADQLAGALIPDIVTIDFSKPVQFPNGRRLQDDVIDVALGLVLNRGGASGVADGIAANDKVFGGSFPYLAEPHAATPAAARLPSTGSGGFLNEEGTAWALSATLLLLALSLAGLGTLAAMRNRGH